MCMGHFEHADSPFIPSSLCCFFPFAHCVAEAVGFASLARLKFYTDLALANSYYTLDFRSSQICECPTADVTRQKIASV